MRRLLVNDCLTTIPGTSTFWSDLQEWFSMEFVGGEYALLQEWFNVNLCAAQAEAYPGDAEYPSLLVRNASYFPPLVTKHPIPTISLLQDIFTEGPAWEMQRSVLDSSWNIVFNSEFTMSCYPVLTRLRFSPGQANPIARVIPLPVDFTLFEPGNPMGLQQALSLPDKCVLWTGAQSQIKGFDYFWTVARVNPDIHFVAVFKDAIPEYGPPNVRMYSRLTHADLVKVIGACRVGLCTSRMESQHLAGIEMGACGLPLVAPQVGTYWKRDGMPGVLVNEPSVEAYSQAIRLALQSPNDAGGIRKYWEKDFSKPVIRSAWERLIAEVECSGAS
jgi:glycosyltransferase involved in cell wall biosynthesis